MSAYKTTKNHLISQLFWQTEIGADEAISAYPSVHDEMTSLKQFMALLKTPAQLDLSQPKLSSEPVSVIQQNTGSGASISEENSGVSDTIKRASLVSLTTLIELKIALEKFEGCSLKNTASQLVFSDGNPDAKIMMIGEAPGKDEDRMGVPFVGQAGQLLDKMLKSIGLNRQQIYITNFIPWRPPGNRTPSSEEISQLKPFMLKHIQLKKPDIIVALGGVSAKALLDTDLGILKLRGRFQEKQFGLEQSIRILPTLHPAYLLRAPAQKKLAFQDLVLLKRAITNGMVTY
jgi:DNA polymerase